MLPKPYALFGCMKGKRRHADKTWGSFMAFVNKDMFVSKFTQTVNRLEIVLDTGTKTRALAGALDFQGIVSNEGDIYLIDIALHPPEKNEKKLRHNQQYEKDDQSLDDCHKTFDKLLYLTKTHIEISGFGSESDESDGEGRKVKHISQSFASPMDKNMLDQIKKDNVSLFEDQNNRKQRRRQRQRKRRGRHREHHGEVVTKYPHPY